jgi:hypothetical protein
VWYQAGDFSLKQAKDFLRKDFIKVVRRTKYVYVQRKPAKRIGYGFFEPVLLALAWCDFLGALYCGDGRPRQNGGLSNEERITRFVVDVLGEINSRYKGVSQDIVRVYRHGTVHAYAPAGAFRISVNDPGSHLKKVNGQLGISVADLLGELVDATNHFARILRTDSRTLKPGTLVAFNKARSELNGNLISPSNGLAAAGAVRRR